MEKTYTVKEVADVLGYSTNSIYTFLKEGRITGIRVGKGRYRVSQEELNKLLNIKENQSSQVSEIPAVRSTSIKANVNQPSVKEIPSLSLHLEKTEDNRPSLFDWFISLTSIVTGLSMILFVNNSDEFSRMSLSNLFISIKINLLMGGVGLFVVNHLNQAKRFWYKIFYLIICVNFVGISLLLFVSKDVNGAFYYIAALLVILLQFVIKQKGTISFKIFMSILTYIVPITLFYNPASIIVNQTSSNFYYLAPVILIALVISMTLYLWVCCRKRNSVLNWLNFAVICLILAYLSYIYAGRLYWSRSLHFILSILFLFITSFWDLLNQNYKDTQKILANIFTNITMIFVIIISLVWIMQNNLRSNVEQTLINKLVYGQNIVDSAIESSVDKIEALSNNKLFKEAMEKKDPVIRNELIKNIFVYSSNFRRLVLVDKDGNVVFNYPTVDLSIQNVSFRDYFKEVKSTKRIYVSNLFETFANGIKRNVVSVNAPIFDGNYNFNGILVGSLDTDLITSNLQMSANQRNKEYFILIDGTNKIISIPENVILSNDEIKHLATDYPNIEESLDFKDKFIQVHTKIKDTGWIIALRRPLANTYNFNDSTNFLLQLIFIFPGLLIIYLNIIHIKKY